MGKKKEKQRKKVSAKWVYIGFYRWIHRRTRSVGIPAGESAGDCAASLYRDPDLNPSVIPSVKLSEKKNQLHHNVATFQKNYIIRRRYGRYIPTNIFRRYIPTVSPTGIVYQYIPIEVEMELLSSVILLVFADFLIESWITNYIKQQM